MQTFYCYEPAYTYDQQQSNQYCSSPSFRSSCPYSYSSASKENCPLSGSNKNVLKVEVAHGSDRHQIQLNCDQDIKVSHLQDEI
ncbi:unnamed protein product, partial [Didymodactylos carnosus]